MTRHERERYQWLANGTAVGFSIGAYLSILDSTYAWAVLTAGIAFWVVGCEWRMTRAERDVDPEDITADTKALRIANRPNRYGTPPRRKDLWT